MSIQPVVAIKTKASVPAAAKTIEKAATTSIALVKAAAKPIEKAATASIALVKVSDKKDLTKKKKAAAFKAKKKRN